MKLSKLAQIYLTFLGISAVVNMILQIPISLMLYEQNLGPAPQSPVKFATIKNGTIIIDPQQGFAIYQVQTENGTNVTVYNLSELYTICQPYTVAAVYSLPQGDVLAEVCNVVGKMIQPPSSSTLALFGFWVPMFFSVLGKTITMLATFPAYLFVTLYPIASVNPIYVIALAVGCVLLGLVHIYTILEIILKKWVE